MKILAITPYAGSKKLVAMTEQMLASFKACVDASNIEVQVAAMNNAAERHIASGLAHWNYTNEKNEGFGNAINLIIKAEIIDPPHLKIVPMEGPVRSAGTQPGFTHVLLLNNDLQFTDVDWLKELVAEAEGMLVLSPCTDVTATAEAVSNGRRNVEPIRHREVSAFCWLVPVGVIHALRRKFGFNLFHPEFSNYGSDDVTAACLRSIVDPKPFKIVPRAWVKHLKAQTANELGVKAGTKELLQRIANFKRARRLS